MLIPIYTQKYYLRHIMVNGHRKDGVSMRNKESSLRFTEESNR